MDAFKYKYRVLKSTQVHCSWCYDVMSLADFVKKHSKEYHDLNDRKQCVFCLGEYSWRFKKEENGKHYKHMKNCMLKYLKLNRYEPEVIADEKLIADDEEEEMIAADLEEKNDEIISYCENCASFDSVENSKKMCDRQLIDQWVRDKFYDLPDHTPRSFWIDEKLDVPFSEESGLCGRVASGMLRMLEGGRWRFLHVFVRPCIYERFSNFVKKLGNRFAISPFGCLCDGNERDRDVPLGPEESKVHRHMVVATDLSISSFVSEWKRLTCPFGRRHHHCKAYKSVKDTLHLASAICYDSQQYSRCGGREKDLVFQLNGTLMERCHFNIFSAVYPHGIVALCCTRPGLLKNWIRIQNRNKNIGEWNYEKYRNDRNHLHYRVRIGDTGIPVRDCVIPLAKEWEIVREVMNDNVYPLYLLDEILYVRRKDPGSETNREMLMLNSIDDSYYTFGNGQSKTANELARAREKWENEMHREMLLLQKTHMDQIRKRDEEYNNSLQSLNQENLNLLEKYKILVETLRKRDEENLNLLEKYKILVDTLRKRDEENADLQKNINSIHKK